MRLILSRKGFDSTSGGCPSPIFRDGSMIALPIPDRSSPVRYEDLAWRGRNLGDVVEALTRGKQRRSFGAHLDPDLRPALRQRPPGWTPLLGQRGAAQIHLRNQGVGAGDLFLFWGVFRPVNDELQWTGPPVHVLWGWLQVGDVVPVDAIRGLRGWSWAAEHPHFAFPENPANTLYVAAPALTIPGAASKGAAGSGSFDRFDAARQLSAAPGARRAGTWKLPACFLPDGRRALTYHSSPSRWRRAKDHVLLDVVSRGQEFVLDTAEYPDVLEWFASLIAGSFAPSPRPSPPLARGRGREFQQPVSGSAARACRGGAVPPPGGPGPPPRADTPAPARRGTARRR
jgi:hypothetical protein